MSAIYIIYPLILSLFILILISTNCILLSTPLFRHRILLTSNYLNCDFIPLGVQFTDPILISHFLILQPYGNHWRNDLYVDVWDDRSREWCCVGRYQFDEMHISLGPVLLPVVGELSIEDFY